MIVTCFVLQKFLTNLHVLILPSTVFYGCSLVSVLSVGIRNNQERIRQFFLPHEFGLNNNSSSILFYNYTSKPSTVCILKSALSEGLTPIHKVILLQFRLAWFQSNLLHRKYGFVNTFANPMMHHLTDFVTKLYLYIPMEPT